LGGFKEKKKAPFKSLSRGDLRIVGERWGAGFSTTRGAIRRGGDGISLHGGGHDLDKTYSKIWVFASHDMKKRPISESRRWSGVLR